MKKLGIFLAGLAAVVIVILVLVLVFPGPILKSAINSYGPGITRTRLQVEAVDASVFSGRASVRNFVLGNPEGFQSPEAISVETVQVDVDESTILQDPLIIDTIRISAPLIHYEIKGKTDNFRAILENIEEASGKGAPQGPEAPKKKKKSVRIKDFYLTDASVVLAAGFLNRQTKPVRLPDIHLRDIGTTDQGASAAEVVEIIIARLYAAIRSDAARDALQQELNRLGHSLEKLQQQGAGELFQLKEEAEKELDSVKDSVKRLLGR
jgi:hypothetical protein